MARYESARSRLRIDDDIRERERHRANEKEIPVLRLEIERLRRLLRLAIDDLRFGKDPQIQAAAMIESALDRDRE